MTLGFLSTLVLRWPRSPYIAKKTVKKNSSKACVKRTFAQNTIALAWFFFLFIEIGTAEFVSFDLPTANDSSVIAASHTVGCLSTNKWPLGRSKSQTRSLKQVLMKSYSRAILIRGALSRLVELGSFIYCCLHEPVQRLLGLLVCSCIVVC